MEVSIIIVHFNQPHFLLPLVEFLVHQDFGVSVECIVVDNLSSSSPKIRKSLSKFNDIILLPLEDNFGPSYARNRGVEVATGKYIQFLDADDWFDRAKLQKQYKVAEENGWPCFVAGKWARVKLESPFLEPEVTQELVPDFTSPLALSIIKSDGFVPLMAGIIHREDFLEVNGFDESLWLIEDVNLLLKLLEVGKDFTLSESSTPMFYYRTVKKSLSGTRKEMFWESVFFNSVKALSIIKKTPNYHTEELNTVFFEITNTAMAASVESNNSNVIQAIKRFMREENIKVNNLPFWKSLIISLMGLEGYWKLRKFQKKKFNGLQNNLH